MVIPVDFGKSEFAHEFKIDLILNDLKEEFMQTISQCIIKYKLLSFAVSHNLLDGSVILRKGEFLKLSKSDIRFPINLKIVEDKGLFLLTATQL